MFQQKISQQFMKLYMKLPITEQYNSSKGLSLPYIGNTSIISLVNHTLYNKMGGIYFMISPPSSGKSTYLRKTSNDYIRNNGYVNYIPHLLNLTTEQFRITPIPYQLSMIPPHSTIIFDQVFSSKETKEILLTCIEDTNFITGTNIIITTSFIDDAHDLIQYLSRNQKKPLQQIGKCKDYEWTELHIRQYLLHWKQFHIFNENEKNRILNYAIMAGTPGFLLFIAQICENSSYPMNDQLFRFRAKSFRNQWNTFHLEKFL